MFRLFSQDLTGQRSPEIAEGPWLNSKPLRIKKLKGKVVLVDFWTYSCVNCLRTLPYLRAWHQKYDAAGLVILGVHTPEFEFEKNLDNVKAQVLKLDLKYPIVLDSEHKTWQNFSNQAWPAKYLVDKKGIIRYTHFGEGAYTETEKKILELLQGEKTKIENVRMEKDYSLGAVCYPTTAETYCGYWRGEIANPGGIKKDLATHYENNFKHLEEGIYLQGVWKAEREFLQHALKTSQLEDYLVLKFKALEVNAVMESKEETETLVYYNDNFLQKEIAGKDIEIVKSKSRLKVQEPRMYNLIKSQELLQGELKLQTTTDQFKIYAFTFGGCL